MATKIAGIVDFDKLIKSLESTKEKAEKVISRTMSDIKSRGPGWISKGVRQEYAISAGAMPKGKGKGDAGTLKFTGDSFKTLQLIYSGERLTPSEFKMSPKKPSDTYTLKAEILKGQKKVLGKKRKLTKKQRQNVGRNFTRQGTQNSPRSPIMLMPTGSRYIPFQRVSQDRKDIEVIKTISLPQMVTVGENGPLHPTVEREFNAGLEKRWANNIKILQR